MRYLIFISSEAADYGGKGVDQEVFRFTHKVDYAAWWKQRWLMSAFGKRWFVTCF